MLQTALMVLVLGFQPYGEAQRESIKTGKPLLVLVGATWCDACQAETALLGNMQTLGQLEGVVVTKVDYDAERAIAQKLLTPGNGTIPELVLFYRDGQQRWRRRSLIGGKREEEILGLFRRR